MLSAKVHRTIYIVLVAILGASMVTSVFVANMAWVFLGLNWLLEGRWREKWQMAKESRLLQAFVGFYVLMLAGMLWTSNTGAGWGTLQVMLPLLCVPMVMLTTRPITGNARKALLAWYTLAVFVVSIIGLVRWLTIPGLPHRAIVPYISHIRFALSCCMVVYLCVGTLIDDKAKPLRWIAVPLIAWMLVFMVIIHSYTGIIVLALVSLVMLLTRWRRWPLVMLWVLLVGGAAAVVGYEVKNYYHMVPMAEAPLREFTFNGRPYVHAQDGIIENGNYIDNYVCEEELRSEWNRRSTLDYDSSDARGYSIKFTLTRYLNALGLTKDSVGVAVLSDEQIASVERGVANPVYESGNVLRKMVYTMLLEREFYVHTHAVAGFTMLQRLEMWRAATHVIGEHPWFGVGTGDAVDNMHDYLVVNDSELSDKRMNCHSQYLGIMVALGIVGFAVVLLLFLRTVFPLHKFRRAISGTLMLPWLLTILISMVTEDTLATLAGILFCTYFLAFRNKE